MRRTYVARMPDEAGAFLSAGRIIAAAGGNIVRVNYNKAVDLHTMFIEVDAAEEQLHAITDQLRQGGYLPSEEPEERILLIVLRLPDEPGALTPVLEILSRRRVNISYISSQSDGSPYQHFKMGLLIENTGEIRQLLEEISAICEVSIPEYEVTDRLLDGAVFYVTFANEMRQILSLTQKQTREVLICANRMMQLLDEQNKPVLQTFDYIRRFARFVRDRRGEAFRADVSEFSPAEGLSVTMIEPPCGSNTYILRYRDELLFVDTGFALYRPEMLALFEERMPGWESLPRRAFITHADEDHAGLLDLFSRVSMSESCRINFELERQGKPNFREQNPPHAPYCALSKVISGYTPPPAELCDVVGERAGEELFCYLGSRRFGNWDFDFYEGPGGHVRGETVIVCEALRLVFSGDIYVNIRGFSAEQREFNSLAPFLMTGVDCDGALSRRSREELLRRWGDHTICPGHGAVELR